jgi:hypothetical protein
MGKGQRAQTVKIQEYELRYSSVQLSFPSYILSFIPLQGVCIATGYGLEDPISIRGRASFSLLQSPDRLWGSPGLLPMSIESDFSGVKAAGA